MTENAIDIRSELLRFQSKLLDLSLRNPLLNYKIRKRKTVLLEGQQPDTVFHRLVEQFRPMKINPLSADSEQEHLHTPYQTEELEDLLRSVSRDAKTIIEETGINYLHLAVGFLKWKEEAPTTDEYRLAPILLVPVEIRSRVQPSGELEYFVAWDEDDVQTNPSLRKKLETDFRLTLPDRSEDETPSAFFASIQPVLQSKPGWQITETMLLGFFSFHKLSMYADIHPENWERTDALKSDALPYRLMVGSIGNAQPSLYAEDYAIDAHRSACQIELPLDADSSQHSAIADISEGKSLVIEGPPGTGKSQTIANAIAHAMNQGKRVLFVAEKLAALDVVAKRLNSIGLGTYCLEMHGHSVAPKCVFESLATRLNCPSPSPNPLLSKTREQIQSAKETIESYLNWTNQESGPYREPLHELLWRMIPLRQQGMVSLQSTELDLNLSREELDECKTALNAFARTANEFGSPSQSEWFGFFPEDFSASRLTTVKECISQLRTLAHSIDEERRALDNLLGSRNRSNLFLSDPPSDRIQELRASYKQGSGIAWETLVDPELQSIALEMEGCVGTMVRCEATLDRVWPLWKKYSDDDSRIPNDFALELLRRFDPSAPVLTLEAVESWVSTTRSIQERLQNHVQTISDVIQEPLERIDESIRKAKMLALLGEPVWNGLESIPQEWFLESTRRSIAAALETNQQLQTRRRELEKHFQLDRTPHVDELRRLLESLKQYSRRWWRLLDSTYRTTLQTIRGFASFPRFFGISRMIHSLELLNAFETERIEFANRPEWMRCLGSLYQKEDTDWDLVSQIWERVARLQSFGADANQANRFRSLQSRIQEKMDWEEFLRAWDQWSLQFDSPIAMRLVSPNTSLSQGGWKQADHQLAQWGLGIQQLAAFANLAGVGKSSPISELEQILSNWTERRSACERASVLSESQDPKRHLIWNYVRYQGGSIAREIEWLRDFQALGLGMDAIRQLDRMGAERLCESLCRIASEVATATTRWNEIRGLIGTTSEMNPGWAHWSKPHEQDLKGELNDDLIGPMDRLESQIERLEAWFGVCRTIARCKRSQCDAFVWKAFEQEPISEQLGDGFELTLLERIAEAAVSDSTWGQRFTRTELEDAIAAYQKHDLAFQALTSQDIQRNLIQRPVPIGTNRGRVGEFTELGLIKHEVSKKLRHCKIRDLMSRAGNAVQALKPCFLMSPLSLARYLPAESISFDLVIMDEASQIKPEDAIGAILRAKQLVVVGDPKQLPPTQFFDRQIAEDEEADQTQFDRAESILEVAMRAFQPCRRLRWHYRSQHEHLIRFSNDQFYDGDLVVFPSPKGPDAGYGIRSHFVEDGRFSQGINEREGQVIAQAIVNHAWEHSDESLGVAAFNQTQAEWIDDQVAMICRRDPRAAEAVARLSDRHDGLFIKNLESIQGDERDVMFLSYTYGPDVTTGKVFQRFGPINFDAGWRRLNVLVTRARKRMEVFSSLRFDQIAAGGNTSRGVHALRDFLQFIQSDSAVDRTIPLSRHPETPLEQAVASVVRSMGLEPVFRVGVSGCFLDVAVRHPNAPTEYLIAIESDGTGYREAKSARDRDRIRNEVLQERGWPVHRIWCVDWFLHQPAEEVRLRKAIGRQLAIAS